MTSPRMTGLFSLALAAATTASAQSGTLSCNDRHRDQDRDGVRVCEIRETSLTARDLLQVNAAPNGGIRIRAWEGNGIRLRARVEARARSSIRAEEIIGEVEIDTEGTIRADGPRTMRREYWQVTFELFVPRNTDLDLQSTNGGIAIEGVRSRMELATVNGGISLVGAGGDVRGHTTNGGIDIELTGTGWDGEGLDLRTTNGGVALAIPEGYGARVETSTVNGGMDSDFPITVRGRIGREMNFDVGPGGKTLRVRTTNGGVSLRRS